MANLQLRVPRASEGGQYPMTLAKSLEQTPFSKLVLAGLGPSRIPRRWWGSDIEVPKKTDDVLAGELTVKAHIEETGLTVAARSRAINALDRLVGAAFDWPAAVLERRARGTRAEAGVDEKLIEARGKIEERVLTAQGERVLERALRTEQRKQWNLNGIAIKAVEELKALPSPSKPEPEPASSESAGADPMRSQVDEKSIDDDWLNAFERLAADASSERLQSLWARILAGEIKQVGSYSRTTLRFISELDAALAHECELVAKSRLQDIVPGHGYWSENEGLNILLSLQTAGLVTGVAGVLSRTLTIGANGTTALAGNKYALILKGIPGVQKAFSAVTITRMGLEVFSLLPDPDEQATLEAMLPSIEKSQIDQVDLARITSRQATTITFQSERVVWRPS